MDACNEVKARYCYNCAMPFDESEPGSSRLGGKWLCSRPCAKARFKVIKSCIKADYAEGETIQAIAASHDVPVELVVKCLTT